MISKTVWQGLKDQTLHGTKALKSSGKILNEDVYDPSDCGLPEMGCPHGNNYVGVSAGFNYHNR
jgi:hypothetical protein